MQKLPTALLAFANSKADLETLKQESANLKDALLPLEHEGLINVEREESITIDEVYKRVLDYRNDLIFFHYAGHAESDRLLLEGNEVNAAGIASLLGQAPYLQLVFLNGCNTHKQAARLHQEGVKIVISTLEPINDGEAGEVAVYFYRALSRRDTTVLEAFEFARSFWTSKYSKAGGDADTRGIRVRRAENRERIFPWTISYRKDKEAYGAWRIDTDVKTVLNLRLGSAKFLQKLIEGPFSYHRHLVEPSPEPDPETGSSPGKPGKETNIIRLDKAEEGPQPFGEGVRALWKEPQPHAWLSGVSGSGKTGAIIQLWKRLLQEADEEKFVPVPVLVDLGGYQRGNDHYIMQYLSQYYLELEGFSELREIMAINLVMANPLYTVEEEGTTVPSVILFLDGSLITDESFLDELDKIKERPGVQIIYSIRKENLENLTPRQENLGFHTLEVQVLSDEQIKKEIGMEVLGRFRKDIQKLIENRRWLSLFQEFHLEMIRDEEQQKKQFASGPYQFIHNFSTLGEFLWNFFEAKLKIAVPDEKIRDERLFFKRFFLRQFLPMLAYRMGRNAGQGNVPVVTEDQLMELINEIGSHFYKPWFLRVFPEFRRYLGNFYLDIDVSDWVAKEERFAIVVELGKEFGIFIQNGSTYSIPNLDFLHFLMASHILNDITTSLSLTSSDQIPPTIFQQEKLESPVRVMVGELDGIHYNRPNGVLNRLMEQCRYKFNRPQLGYTLWNILTTWTDIKGYFTGLVLNDLDLRGAPLSRLSKELGYDPFFLSCRLEGALVDREDIFQGSLKKNSQIRDFCYSASGKILVSGESDGIIRLWNTRLGICFKIIEAKPLVPAEDTAASPYAVNAVRISPDGKYLFSGSTDKTIKVWETHTENCLLVIGGNELFAAPDFEESRYHVIEDGHHRSVTCLASREKEGTPGVFELFSGSEDYTVIAWEIDIPNHRVQLRRRFGNGEGEGHRDEVRSVDISGQTLASGSYDGTVRLWNMDQDQSEVLDKHVSRVHSVSFNPGGRYLASASSDDTVIVWDLNRRLYVRLRGHTRNVNSVRFRYDASQGRHYLFSGGSDQKVIVWFLDDLLTAFEGERSGRRKSWKELPPPANLRHVAVEALPDQVTCVDVSPVANHFAASLGNGAIQVYGLVDSRLEKLFSLDNTYELHVQGSSFKRLHAESTLTEEDRTFLRRYGAIFEDEDEKNWFGEIIGSLREGG